MVRIARPLEKLENLLRWATLVHENAHFDRDPLLVGCGGSSVSIEDFPHRYADAICSKNFECCDPTELEGETKSECVTTNQQVLAFLVASINTSRAPGRVSFDTKPGGTCIDSLKSMT